MGFNRGICGVGIEGLSRCWFFKRVSERLMMMRVNMERLY